MERSTVTTNTAGILHAWGYSSPIQVSLLRQTPMTGLPWWRSG